MNHSEFISVVGGIVGSIGGVLGIFTWIANRLKNKQFRRKEMTLWKMYVDMHRILKAPTGNVTLTPEIGSHLHKLAEEMVERGWLSRAPKGGFCLPD